VSLVDAFAKAPRDPAGPSLAWHADRRPDGPATQPAGFWWGRKVVPRAGRLVEKVAKTLAAEIATQGY